MYKVSQEVARKVPYIYQVLESVPTNNTILVSFTNPKGFIVDRRYCKSFNTEDLLKELENYHENNN